MGLTYLLARGESEIVISHDTDILNYSPSMLAKLCYPVAHPRLGYQFVKGYYSRVADRLYGRVTRLLIFPLIQSFQDVLGPLAPVCKLTAQALAPITAPVEKLQSSVASQQMSAAISSTCAKRLAGIFDSM